MDIPISILYLYIGIVMTIGILGITLGLKKVAGSPFITIFAGIMLFGMIALIENVEVDYVEAINYNLTYPMNVVTGATGVSLDATFKALAEKPANTDSLLYNTKISCMDVQMVKVASPTGTVFIGILDGNNNVVKQFGSIVASDLATTTMQYKFCLPNHDYWIISLYDRIGVKYTNGDGTNKVNVIRHTSDTFDGTNTIRSLFSTSWSDTTTDDVRMILTDDTANIIGEPVLQPFNQEDIWVFTAVLSFFFTYMGVMLQFSKWTA